MSSLSIGFAFYVVLIQKTDPANGNMPGSSACQAEYNRRITNKTKETAAMGSLAGDVHPGAGVDTRDAFGARHSQEGDKRRREYDEENGEGPTRAVKRVRA